MIRVSIRKKLDFFEGKQWLEVDTQIEDKEFIVIYGPSGAGKTTLLRLLAGLSTPDEGVIEVNGLTWFDSTRKIDVSAQKRNLGFVFQDYALFPNMTVRENLEYGLTSAKGDIDKLVDLLSLRGMMERKPALLSGGQKQRVALGRALARRPPLLLLDEPLSALDLEARLSLQGELSQIHKEYNLTTLMVSHDANEITRLAQRVLVLKSGEVTKDGAPAEILPKKKTKEKVRFSGNLIKIEKESSNCFITVSSGNNTIRVQSTEQDLIGLDYGDPVTVILSTVDALIVKNINEDKI